MVQTVVQVMRKSHEARQKLLRLGIFRKVEVVIDTSQGTGSHCVVFKNDFVMITYQTYYN